MWAIPRWSALTLKDVPLALTIGLLAVGVLGFWPWPTIMDYRTGKLALLEIGLLAMVAALSRNWPLRLFLWWGLGLVLMDYNWRALVTIWRLFLAVAGIELVASMKRASLPTLLNAWRGITVLHTTYMLLQFLGAELFFIAVRGQPVSAVTGFMDNAPLAGAYTAMTLPLFVSDGWSRWLIPSLLAVAATHSLGAILISLVLLGIVGLRVCPCAWMPRSAILLACVAGLGLYSLVIEPLPLKVRNERSNRVVVWRQTGHMILTSVRHTLIGYGPGQYAREFRRHAIIANPDLRWTVAHNEPLQAWFEFGAIGLALCVACSVRWLWAGFRSVDANVTIFTLIFLGAVLSGCYYFSAHVACLAVVWIVGAGVLEGARRRLDATA